ncbi:diguanylate cyclase [Paenibacillus sp. FSL F4-0087]|uniref:Diguanylate cyclase n=1 Tax=Paenibacillus taichungensis TaxID=484184 RepID=A0ABX2MJN3_9BACL|nr:MULTISPECIES: diguanylate cyclase [Paenibacillus]MDR9747836.1 diguanylate cyclase [Paenibacillus taichungensis]NUU54253.1 diguanylate cyclase [Paenibacillus taichungensis]OME85712.1 GGDEF domain-containing protein [Paenibacillus pabuli]PIH58159.1 GGDEF domain-containing protein [Paenibacillus sp. LK1]
MLSTFFVNLCVMITFMYVSGIIAKFYRIRVPFPSMRVQMIGGLLFGIYGTVLMNYSFPLNETTIVDLRHLAIVTAAVYLGGLASVISGLVISILRIIMFGMSSAAIDAAFVMTIIGLSGVYFAYAPWSRLTKIITMNLLGMTLIFVILMLNTTSMNSLLKVYPLQMTISFVGGIFIYFIAEFINKSNEMLFLLERKATTDHLTNLSNRRQFEKSLEFELERAREYKQKLSLLVIDIDRFKKVNDTFGHTSGDAVLKQLGQLLIEHARSADIVSRNGGEEFAILLLDCGHHQAMAIAESIRQSVEKYHFALPDGNTIRLTISIGVAVFPDHCDDRDDNDFFEQADRALYEAKNTGRNRVCAIPLRSRSLSSGQSSF